MYSGYPSSSSSSASAYPSLKLRSPRLSSGYESVTGYVTAPESSQSSSRLPARIPEYDVIPPEEVPQYLAQPPEPVEYNEPLAASYFIKPPEFVDDPFPEINELGNYDLSYIEGVREKLAKSIKSVTGQINLDEIRSAQLTPEQVGVLEYRKAYKQALVNYRDAFMPYLKQRRRNIQRERRGRGISFTTLSTNYSTDLNCSTDH